MELNELARKALELRVKQRFVKYRIAELGRDQDGTKVRLVEADADLGEQIQKTEQLIANIVGSPDVKSLMAQVYAI